MSDSDSRGPHCDELSCKPLGLGFVYANQPMWRANERQTSQRLGFASLRSRFCYAKKFAFVLCCNISYFLFRSAVVCMQKAYLEQYTAWFGLVGSAKPRSFPFPIMGITPLGLAWLAGWPSSLVGHCRPALGWTMARGACAHLRKEPCRAVLGLIRRCVRVPQPSYRMCLERSKMTDRVGKPGRRGDRKLRFRCAFACG